eukprot:7377342-Prymnesium_polylepis.4
MDSCVSPAFVSGSRKRLLRIGASARSEDVQGTSIRTCCSVQGVGGCVFTSLEDACPAHEPQQLDGCARDVDSNVLQRAGGRCVCVYIA